MKLLEAIDESVSDDCKFKFRRSAWTHGDSVVIKNYGGYNGGELWWELGNKPIGIFFIGDLEANDWVLL